VKNTKTEHKKTSASQTKLAAVANFKNCDKHKRHKFNHLRALMWATDQLKLKMLLS